LFLNLNIYPTSEISSANGIANVNVGMIIHPREWE